MLWNNFEGGTQTRHNTDTHIITDTIQSCMDNLALSEVRIDAQKPFREQEKQQDNIEF